MEELEIEVLDENNEDMPFGIVEEIEEEDGE